MPRFAANLSWLFTEAPFMERFEMAAKAGFKAVECGFPYDFAPTDLAAALEANHLTQVLFNLSRGNSARGDRGIAALPGREHEFVESVQCALEYAQILRCSRLHVMAGICNSRDRQEAHKIFIDRLCYACEKASEANITLLLEPINQRDIPGYFLENYAQARKVLQEIRQPCLKIQLDWYHAQIIQGDLSRLTEELSPDIGHIQVAGVPDRHEPDIGEVNYFHLFQLVDHLKYSGWIGCEYKPKGRTTDGLGWLRRDPHSTRV
jgi:hydroxypyruvate isomerase